MNEDQKVSQDAPLIIALIYLNILYMKLSNAYQQLNAHNKILHFLHP